MSSVEATTGSRCPLCDSQATEVERRFDASRPHHLDHVRPFEKLLRCRDCRFGFRWPRLANGDVEAFYEKAGYWPEAAVGLNGYYQAVARSRVAFIRRHAQPARILDVGASNGAFLLAWRASLPGVCLEAVETDPQCRSFIESQGIPCHARPPKGETFGLVALAHVAEHYPEPVSFLRPLFEKCVAPGGYLFLEVPYRDYRRKDLMQPAVHHVSFFEKESIERLARILGMTPLEIGTYGRIDSRIHHWLRRPSIGVGLSGISRVEVLLTGRRWLKPYLLARALAPARPDPDGAFLRAILRRDGD